MKAAMVEFPEPDDQRIVIGKDILELLSSSMYVYPLTIYREYVQNAADAIDEAIAEGVLASVEDGSIEITLNHADRQVLIRDNGTGVPNDEFRERMLSIGASRKRGTDARGFRGVGRLSGLGYAQELIFRSRAEGDPLVLEAAWDCRVIKFLLASVDSDIDLVTIVRRSVSIREADSQEYPSHFFEVELRKPRRIANDKLLNEKEIESYLSQTCPCPFAPGFSYGPRIGNLLAPYGRAGRSYRIFLNGSEAPVFRPYRNTVMLSETRSSALGALRTIEIEGLKGGVAAVGWLIHHDYQGAIPVSEGVRGLRARVGNIQVGDDRLFSEIFPEDRFCSWTIGEVHVLDPRVVPNGRRDDFEPSGHLANILAHLRPFATEVARECRISSQRRNRIKSFDLGAVKVAEKLDVIEQRAVSEKYSKAVKREIGSLLSEMRKAAESDLLRDEDKDKLKSRYAEIESSVDRHAKRLNRSALDNLPQGRRKAYEEVFDLIYECSVNHVAAKSLIDRMLHRLSRA